MNDHGPVQSRNGAVPVIITLVSVGALGAMVFGGLSVTGGAKPHTNKITGTYTVTDPGAFEAPRSCGTDAVKDGTPVAVRDSAGKVIGIGRLADGTGVKTPTDTDKASLCRFTFVVLKVPATETYQLRVGAAQAQTFDRATMTADRWHVDLV